MKIPSGNGRNYNESYNASSHLNTHRLRFSNFYWSGQFNSEGYGIRPAHNMEWGPIIIIPILATIILAISVFLLIIFRQNPTFVISTVAGCLIFITVYLTLAALDEARVAYE